MSVITLTEDPDQVDRPRIVCDVCDRAYIAHPDQHATRRNLEGYATDHGWDIGPFGDMCPPCTQKRPSNT